MANPDLYIKADNVSDLATNSWKKDTDYISYVNTGRGPQQWFNVSKYVEDFENDNVTYDSITEATEDNGIDVASKLNLTASDGADSASGLLMGIGTSGDPAVTSTADAKFIELRLRSNATSGDNRAIYLRYSLNGAGGGGEAVRAFTKLEKEVGTARGAHISLDVASAGSTTGLGVGVDGQLLVHDGALAGGTYAALNSEIYSAGSSTDVSGVTNISFLRCVAGGDSTGIANVDDNALFADFSGVAAGSGNMIDTDITTHTAYGGLRVNIPGVGVRYLALVSA